MTARPRVMLPPPAPHRGAQRCPTCDGAKLTGARYEMNLDNPTVRHRSVGSEPAGPVLLADVLCPTCRGCGRAAHDGCDPAEHADWPDPDIYDTDHDPDSGEDLACPSCHGRRWWACQGFSTRATGVTHLRVACGCAAELLVPATEPNNREIP